MNRIVVFSVLAVLLAAGGLAAQQQGMPGGMSGGMQRQADPSLGVGRSMMQAPIRSEQDFVVSMIPHHLEAADAALLIAVTTRDADLRRLAEGIYRAQYQEVEDLKLHYARAFQMLPAGRRYMPMMRDLNAVSGEARDVQFVEDMIPHHEAAVAMARQALALPSLDEEMRRFAEKVTADQAREIDVMRGWLSRRGG